MNAPENHSESVEKKQGGEEAPMSTENLQGRTEADFILTAAGTTYDMSIFLWLQECQ